MASAAVVATGAAREDEAEESAELEEPTRTVSENDRVDAYTHGLPAHVMWCVTLVTPILVAVTNWLMVNVETYLVVFKFDSVQQVMLDHGLAVGMITLIGICSVLAASASALVCLFAPICAGSGIPEAKGFLNGNFVPGMFQPTNYLVRVLGVVLAVSAGFPIGREGPMVCIGGCIGIGVVHVVARDFLETKVVLGRDMSTRLTHEERLRHAKRIGCALGGAAGVATAFNAPIGAILYMFEEVSVTHWTPELTFRAFVCTVLASFSSRALLYVSGGEVHRLLIYDEQLHASTDWRWIDFPFFVVLAAAVGLCSAVFSIVLLRVWKFRRKFVQKLQAWPRRRLNLARILECALCAAFCALIFAAVPSISSCVQSAHVGSHGEGHYSGHVLGHDVEGHGAHVGSHVEGHHSENVLGHDAEGHGAVSGTAHGVVGTLGEVPSHAAVGELGEASEAGHYRRLSDGHGLPMVQYNCPAGSHNTVATLLLSGAESAVKQLFARKAQDLGLGATALALAAYLPLAMSTPGLAMPMGVFVPCMLIGALIGRAAGEAINEIGVGGGVFAHAGVYAIVGSAAMLGGFTHMTIAIVVLLVEASNDLSVVAPLMVGIFVSHIVSKFINHHAYDEQLIMAKQVPFLDAELPDEMESSGATARHLCDSMPLPAEACLPMSATVVAVKDALKQKELAYFPVLDRGFCLGLITRKRLNAALEACTHKIVVRKSVSGELDSIREEDDVCDTKSHNVIAGICLANSPVGSASVSLTLPLDRLMDPTPFLLLHDMPITRLYPLFSVAAADAACVVTSSGQFHGILTRRMLIDAANHHHHSAHHRESESEGQQSYAMAMNRRVSMTQPLVHHLPAHIIWAITLVIPLLVGVTNYIMVLIDASLVTWKFETIQDTITNYGIFAGGMLLAAICAGLAAMASALVCFVSKICAGSGIPEAKGYLNGNYIHGMFELQNFFVRVVGVVLAVAAGFPIGREGPMVCIGGCLGIGVVHVLALPYVQHSVQMAARTGTHSSLAFFLDEERFRHAKRIGCILGAAAGISTAFGAPVGAILYVFEEVTVTFWPAELTFRAFVCSVCAIMVSRGLLNFTDRDVHRLTIYDEMIHEQTDWRWIDLPFFVALAAIVGIFSAIFTRGLISIWAARQRAKVRFGNRQPFIGVAEATAYAVFCAVAFAFVPLIMNCVEEALPHAPEYGVVHNSTPPMHDRRLSTSEAGAHHLGFVRYTCPQEGAYNEMATLLLSGAEGAVKHLFRHNANNLSLVSLVLSLLVYAPLAMGMAGLPVPMGVFVPCLLIGAIMGRFVGEALAPLTGVSNPGVYSMVGSAAMLGGFTHMTISIVVLLVEACHDLSLTSPLMLAIFVAHIVSRSINEHAYDEQLILRKGVAFLDAELPHELAGRTAFALCSKLPAEACLRREMSAADIQAALRNDSVVHFPVLEGGVCVGLITRARLLESFEARLMGAYGPKSKPAECGRDQEVIDKALKLKTLLSKVMDDDGVSDAIPVHRIMDPAPYTLLGDMPASRFYILFTKAGTHAACVVTKQGGFVGVLSRTDLLAAAAHVGHGHSGLGDAAPESQGSQEPVSAEDVRLELDDDDGEDFGWQEEPGGCTIVEVSSSGTSTSGAVSLQEGKAQAQAGNVEHVRASGCGCGVLGLLGASGLPLALCPKAGRSPHDRERGAEEPLAAEKIGKDCDVSRRQ